MSPLQTVSVSLFGAGAALLLGDAAWFRDRPAVRRLEPYRRAGASGQPGSARDERAALVASTADRVDRLLGLRSRLELRLERAGWDCDAHAFRLRQLTSSLVALLTAGCFAVTFRPGAALTAFVMTGAPAVACLLHEQTLTRAAALRRRQLAAELPLLAEQLGLLLSAGYSVTGSLARVVSRSRGAASSDIERMLRRIRQGQAEREALRSWAEQTGLPAVHRLAAVLALQGEAADLGSLVAEEARSIRAGAHRELLESIERRAQLVWIPVTVATLVPGLLFLAVPFLAALSQVTGGN
jgi:tight adherence protein C